MSESNAAAIAWLTSLAEAEARAGDELILVDFSAAPG